MTAQGVGPDALSLPALDEAALLAHEFRSPLAGIQATAETLARGSYGGLTPAQQEAVDSIARRCRRLESAMAAISELHALESGPEHPPLQPVDVVADVIAPIATGGARGTDGPRLQVSVDAGTLLARGDARLLGIVVDNLVDNAIKYRAPGTEVRVSARREGDRVVIGVRNEGAGIAPADLPRLFRPLCRLRQPGTEAAGGSGLGLYLCRRIVDVLGGAIAVASEPGGATEFLVTLAAMEAPAAER